MFSLGFVCLGQSEPLHIAPDEYPFEVDAQAAVRSHRGDSLPYAPLFTGMVGCTYHVGHWHHEFYFSAWDLLDRMADRRGNRTKLQVREAFRPALERFLTRLADASPTRTVLLFIDVQGLPRNVRRVGPIQPQDLWTTPDAEGFVSGWLYEIQERPGAFN